LKYARYIPITGTAIATTFTLFYLMQALVTTDEIILQEMPPIRMPIFIRQPETPEDVRIAERVPKPKEVAPPPPPPPGGEEGEPSEDGIPRIPGPPIGPPIFPDQAFNPLAVDGERIPLVRVQPEYPEKCAVRGLSGSVVVEFDIDSYGEVINPRILDDSDGPCFRRSALRAIKRFRYKPAIINGQPQGAQNVQFRMVYELAPE